MTLSPPPIVDLEAASRRTFCAVCGLAFTNFFRRRRHQLGHQLEKQAARAKAAKMAAVKAAAALVVAEEAAAAAGQIEQQQLSKENDTLDISLVGVAVAGNCDSDINSSRSSSPKNHNNHNNSSDSDSIELTAIINSNSNANSNSNSVQLSPRSSSSPASHHSDDGGSSATATANSEEGASAAAAAVKTKKTTKGRKRAASVEEVEKEVDDGRCSPVRLDVDLAYRRFRHCRDPVKNSASLLQSPENISTSTSPGSNHHNLLRPISPASELSSRSRRKLPFLLPGHLTQVGVLVTAGACPRSEPPQVITPGGQVLDGRLVAGAGTKKTKSAKMIISGGDQNEDREEEEEVREVQAHGAARMEVRRRGKRKFVAIIQNAITTRTRSRQAAATASIVDPAVPGPSTSAGARTGGEVEDHDEDHEEEEEEEDRLSRRTKRMRITEPTTPPEA